MALKGTAEGGTATTDVARGAMALAQAGWPVFRLRHVRKDGSCSCGKADCLSQGKHPLRAGWQEEATSDVQTVGRLWAASPLANIGVPTGPGSGLLMIGPDGDQGARDLRALEARLGALPKTVRQASGTPGGYHLVFRWPDGGVSVPNRKRHAGTEIDVRGEGGLFVVAPSRNANGQYHWIDHPSETPLADLPASWLAWILDDGKDRDEACEALYASLRGRASGAQRGSVEDRARAYLSYCPPAIAGQRGHDTTFAVARAIVYGFDLGVERGLALLLADYNPRCQPPWTEAELQHKCVDADRLPYGKPRGWLLQERLPDGPVAVAASPPAHASWEPIVAIPDTPPVPAFPLQVFSDGLQRFAQEGAWALNCPVDFLAAPMLGVACGAIGNSRRARITGSHYQPAVLFVCVVGAPGSGKSPALQMVVEPLEEAQRREMDRYRREQALLDEENDDKKAKAIPPTRFLVDDTTQEALVKVLSENPRGVLMVRDELAALIRGMDQYRSGGKGNDRQNFLKMWSQETIRNDRKNNPDGFPVTVHRPFLGVVGGTQPDVVNSLRGEAGRGSDPPNDGLVDRFLFAFPDCPPAAGETWREVSAEATQAWSGAIGHLLAFEAPITDGSLCPVLVGLSQSGRDEWERFTHAHADELNDPDFPEFLRGTWAKLRGYCGRLALVVQCLRLASEGRVATALASPPTITGEDMAAAWLLVDYFKEHARRVLACMSADRALAKARHILGHIARTGKRSFKKSDLFRSVRSKSVFPSMDALDAPLQRLVSHNYLRVVAASKTGPGRPEVDTYEVHPGFSENHPDNPGNPGNSMDEA